MSELRTSERQGADLNYRTGFQLKNRKRWNCVQVRVRR